MAIAYVLQIIYDLAVNFCAFFDRFFDSFLYI